MARDETKGDRNEEKSALNRRSYLKGAGAAVASFAALGGAKRVQAADYRTIKVSRGEYRRISVGSGETFENVLIDISAPGAEVHIGASGSDWTIRNVGIKGQLDSNSSAPNVIMGRGNGTIEHCFFGSHLVPANTNGGVIGVHRSHSGHIDIRECYVAGATDNGVYAAGAAEGGQGTITVDTCYFKNNNVSHVRAACDGDVIKNSVFHNTNNVGSNAKSNNVNSRGIWDFYGSRSNTITIENCDIDITDANTNGANAAAIASSTTYDMRNCRVKGRLRDNVQTTDVGSDPDLSVPAGVPTAPEEAAGGTSSATSEPAQQTTDDQTDEPVEGSVLELVAGSDTSNVTYEFTVEGAVTKRTDGNNSSEGNDELTENGDGTVTVTGVSGNGYGDSFVVDGVITGMELDESAWTVRYDGEEVSVADIAFPKKLVIDGSNRPRVPSTYRFEVNGQARKSTAASINAYDTVGDGEITGRVIGGKDAFRFSGQITGFSLDGPANVRVEDGQ